MMIALSIMQAERGREHHMIYMFAQFMKGTAVQSVIKSQLECVSGAEQVLPEPVNVNMLNL